MILLATLNARYAHTAFGLRYLYANLGELQKEAEILEGTLDDRPLDFAERILQRNPRLLGLSVYIWNAVQSLEVVRLLKRLRPELTIVVGGPEVSHETDLQEICQLADHTVTGEGEVAFRQLCEGKLSGKVIPGGLPEPASLAFPYSAYSDVDLARRVVYVEASRGCPFRCEFCLSSLDKSVRYFPLEPFLAELATLHQRGARHFKFIDRTFNLRLEVSRAILDFFWERYEPGMFCHFEMIPDRFPEELRAAVRRFPPGALQFEIGIQTFNPAVAERISRRQDFDRLEDNLRFLRAETGVHIHADLIVGLPGEDLESFGAGFDRLWALRPQEIQVGILKRLRGTPIVRHENMLYSPSPPYEILQSDALSFPELQELRRFARFWDLVANRGTFPRVLPLLLGDRPFANFRRFAAWLYAKTGATAGIALPRLAELLFTWLEEQGVEATQAMAADFTADGERYLPPFLTARGVSLPKRLKGDRPALPKRQARHRT